MTTNKPSLKKLLSTQIEHAWLDALRGAWPIRLLVGDDEREIGGDDWQCVAVDVLADTSDRRQWSVRLHEPSHEIEAILTVTLYSAERVVEISGELRNVGSGSIKRLRDPRPLDLRFAEGVSPAPFIRRVAGGPFIDVAYPPIGYRIEDVQLLPHYQHWGAVCAYSSVADGRPSVRYQPLMVIGDDCSGGVLVALEWAGPYQIACRRRQPQWTRDPGGDLEVSAGASGIDLTLRPGMALPLPTAWLVFYDGRLDEGGQAWRRFFRDRLAPRLGRDPVMPLASYNHWIAYYINEFTEAHAVANARVCADVGLEYMVFDAGWYVGGFRSGNGNWELVDREKIPSGFAAMGKAVTDAGVRFGSWVEPEYAATDSKLYRDHPDWFLTVEPVQAPGDGHSSMALINFALPEVRGWWVRFLEDWYTRCHVRWVRWDFNQPPGPFWLANDASDEQGLSQIRHIRGLYAALDEVLDACPELVIEQCAGGGTRIEPGILRRGHTYWINDQSSSPHLVRYFQHGMNMFWPAHYANMNVVSRDGVLGESEWLSHQAGSFGVSAPLVDWSDDALAELSRQVARYKGFRRVLEMDFASSSGQPARLAGRHHLAFGCGDSTVEIEHNLDTGEASLQLDGE